MTDPRDYKLDLSGLGDDAPAPTGPAPPRPAPSDPAAKLPAANPSAAAGGSTPGAASAAGRPYLSVHFACCGVYQRVYRDPDGKTYQGRCPRCATPVRFVVGKGGTAARTFVVR